MIEHSNYHQVLSDSTDKLTCRPCNISQKSPGGGIKETGVYPPELKPEGGILRGPCDFQRQ